MLQKHPQADLPSLPLDTVPTPYSLSEATVLKAVRSFPKGSASGPSGLRPSHLREAVGCPSPDCASYLLAALTRFTNILAAGSAPLSITPISVEHLFLLVVRRQVATVLLLSVRSCANSCLKA